MPAYPDELIEAGWHEESIDTVASIIGKKKAVDLLSGFESLNGLFQNLRISRCGLEKKDQHKLLAAFNMARLMTEEKLHIPTRMVDSHDLANLVRESYRGMNYSELRVVLLDQYQNHLKTVAIADSTDGNHWVNAQMVFRPAVRFNAASLALVHNHPSGGHHPTEEDIELTQKLADQAWTLGFKLIDHVIVGKPYHGSKQDYSSLRDLKVMPVYD